jgi:hypothetical protein
MDTLVIFSQQAFNRKGVAAIRSKQLRSGDKVRRRQVGVDAEIGYSAQMVRQLWTLLLA